jgi:hypothetical protein
MTIKQRLEAIQPRLDNLTTQQAKQRLTLLTLAEETVKSNRRITNRINKYRAIEIKKIILEMAKPMRQYSKEEKIVRAFLFDAYEKKTSREKVKALLDSVQSIEWPEIR